MGAAAKASNTSAEPSQRKNYTQVPNHLIRDRNLSDEAFRHAVYLLMRAGQKDNVNASEPQMIADTGKSRRSVQRRVDELKSLGLIEKPGPYKFDLRPLWVDRSAKNDAAEASNMTPQSARNGTQHKTYKTARASASGTRARKNISSAKSNPTIPTDPNLKPEPDGLIDPASSSSGSPVPVVCVTADSNAREADRYLGIVEEMDKFLPPLAQAK